MFTDCKIDILNISKIILYSKIAMKKQFSKITRYFSQISSTPKIEEGKYFLFYFCFAAMLIVDAFSF